MKKIQESLRDLYNFKISEGEIVEKLKDAEALFGVDYEAITPLIREAKRVYADETGWRMEGRNWWLWVFVTERGIRYVIEDTRGKGVAARALGDKTDRVIISDGYSAYQNLPGEKQQCWVHLLRVAKIHSHALYEDLVLLYKQLLLELEKKKEERDKLRKVQARMRHHEAVLFTCLDHNGVLPENNTAERAIRPQVVMRKIFGGSRSLAGAQTHAVNTSVIATLQQQQPATPFFDLIIPLLKKRHSVL